MCAPPVLLVHKPLMGKFYAFFKREFLPEHARMGETLMSFFATPFHEGVPAPDAGPAADGEGDLPMAQAEAVAGAMPSWKNLETECTLVS